MRKTALVCMAMLAATSQVWALPADWSEEMNTLPSDWVTEPGEGPWATQVQLGTDGKTPGTWFNVVNVGFSGPPKQPLEGYFGSWTAEFRFRMLGLDIPNLGRRQFPVALVQNSDESSRAKVFLGSEGNGQSTVRFESKAADEQDSLGVWAFEADQWYVGRMINDIESDIASFYVDGTLVAQTDASNRPSSDDSNLYIGASDGGSVADGAVAATEWDYVRIVRKAVEPDVAIDPMPTVGIAGDFDNNGVIDATDIDLIGTAVRAASTDVKYDLDKNAQVNSDDSMYLVNVILKTWAGDSNLDKVFDSGDFVAVFSIGEYEDGIAGNSGWADGDWNLDADFDTGDLVFAFQEGGFEKGPRAAVAAVPEPASLVSLGLGILALAAKARRKARA
jgi:hypothetical protein